jgi:hypothetical protein
MSKPPTHISKLFIVRAKHRALRNGELAGNGRARVFKDRKKEANRQKCRGKVCADR